MTVTVDNASANDSGVSYLRRQMNNLKTSIAGGKYLHMRCAAHIVNLIVQDGLKEVDTSIKRVRAGVRFFKNSPSRLVKFKECAALEKVDNKAFLSLDVYTRWNSTHDMLAAACPMKRHLQGMQRRIHTLQLICLVTRVMTRVLVFLMTMIGKMQGRWLNF
jgi:hypothetical protein